MLLKQIILKKTINTKKNSAVTKKILNIKKYQQSLKQLKLLNNLQPKNRLIKYVITVRYYRNGVSLTASTIKGNSLLFCTSKQDKNKKKRKINRKMYLKSLAETLTKYCPFLLKNIAALHLINTGFDKKQIVKKLLPYFYILILKTFNTKPYNGCRKPKTAKKKLRIKKSRYTGFNINPRYSKS